MDPTNNLEVQTAQIVSEPASEPAEPKSPCSNSDENEDHLAFVNFVQSGKLAKQNNIKVKDDFISSLLTNSSSEKSSLPPMKNWHFVKRNICIPSLNDSSQVFSGNEPNFVKLMCPICFMFDCQLHAKDDSFQFPDPKQSKDDKSSLITDSCGSDCFLHIIRDKPQKGDCFSLANYDTETQKMLDLLIPSLKRAYCSVVPVLGKPNKYTCKKVYLYDINTRKYETESSEVSGPSTVKPDSKMSRTRYVNYMIKIRKERYGDEAARNIARYPCSHPGKRCDDNEADCPCFRLAVSCEKSCFCSTDCQLRFPGCKCKGNSCCSSKNCFCFNTSRECDPDLCSSCGANAEENNNCLNVAIQRNKGKDLFVAPSSIHGWGTFINENAEKDDFIAEYVGELIPIGIGEERGKIYDENKTSFIFTLDNKYDIDATSFGNLTRFINHSKNHNCYPLIKAVNGEHRIGFYASKRIQKNSELFFDYHYDKTEEKKFIFREL